MSRVDLPGYQNEVRDVFAHYRRQHPRSFPRPMPGSKEWLKVVQRLREGYSVQDLCDAIDGYHRSPFHCGENQGGTKYLGLELIMRDGSHVAQGIQFLEEPALPKRAGMGGVTLPPEWYNDKGTH
jgi:hypothetical protein